MAFSATTDPNGTMRAKKIPREKSRVRNSPKNIVAIDFGTKNCSVGYITESDQLEITRGVPKLRLNGSNMRVATAVLFSPDGVVKSFGNDARALYLNLDDVEREQHIYFEEIKMKLHKDQEVTRDLKVIAMNGQEYFLVDVISHILRYLKEQFLEYHLRRSGHSVSGIQVDWVITVPAIWRARGKQLMREAGYQAGLCSEQPNYPLQVADNHNHFAVEDSNPDRLSLALESESATLYCHEMLQRGQVAPFCDNPSGHYKPHSYLLLDVGGGTVDISAHKVVEYKNGNPIVEETVPSRGNDCGGTMVNREFKNFLEVLVDDVGFSRYLNTPDRCVNISNRCEFNHLINVVFEEQKTLFGNQPEDKRREIVVRLPPSILDVYENDIARKVRELGPEKVNLKRQNLRISVNQMEEFFRPVVEGLVSIVQSTLHALGGCVDVIYLVGGFGGSYYLYQHIFNEFSISYKCIVPPNPDFAVVEGAVLFRANPAVIQSRRMSATYGKSVIRPFDPKIHDVTHRFLDDRDGFLCDNLFQTIVEVGEAISPSHVYMCSSIPCSETQSSMYVEIFRSPLPSKDIWYVKGRRGEVVKVGEVNIQLDEATKRKKSKVDFTFDFSYTEVQVQAYERTTKKTVKIVIDFLSS